MCAVVWMLQAEIRNEIRKVDANVAITSDALFFFIVLPSYGNRRQYMLDCRCIICIGSTFFVFFLAQQLQPNVLLMTF